MSSGPRPPTKIVITVSGGSGTIAKTLFGNGNQIGAVPPSGAAIFDLEILTADGIGVGGAASIRGTQTLQCDNHYYGDHTINISNATADGEYIVVLFYNEF